MVTVETAGMCSCYRAILHHPQTGSEVSQADVTIDVQQDVVWLNVSVTQRHIQVSAVINSNLNIMHLIPYLCITVVTGYSRVRSTTDPQSRSTVTSEPLRCVQVQH